jgi:hypothetical protein
MGRLKFIPSWLNILGQGILRSYPDVSYWVQQFRMRREGVENSRRSGRPPDLQTRFRIDSALEASPNAPIQDIIQTADIVSSTVFSVLTQVLRLEFRDWR